MNTIQSKTKNLVSRATFKIRTKKRGNGQCVLIEGGFILTAAHCVDYECEGGMAMGDFCLSKISTGLSDVIASTLAIEPVSDAAVLGSPDGQSMPNIAIAFDEWVARIAPVKLQRQKPEPFTPFPVWIRTHLKTWVAGEATYTEGSKFLYETASEILCGTSGGPIVNLAGELVGVVSHGSTDCAEGQYVSAAPLLSSALPAWILDAVRTNRQHRSRKPPHKGNHTIRFTDVCSVPSEYSQAQEKLLQTVILAKEGRNRAP